MTTSWKCPLYRRIEGATRSWFQLYSDNWVLVTNTKGEEVRCIKTYMKRRGLYKTETGQKFILHVDIRKHKNKSEFLYVHYVQITTLRWRLARQAQKSSASGILYGTGFKSISYERLGPFQKSVKVTQKSYITSYTWKFCTRLISKGVQILNSNSRIEYQIEWKNIELNIK